MARDIQAAVATELSATRLVPFLLMEAEFDSGDVLFWTGIGPLVWDSKTYTGSGDVIQIEPAEETKQLQATGATIQISGLPSTLLSVILTEEWQQRPCRLRFGVFDTSDDPPSIIVDPFIVFEGRLDQMNWEESGETATIVVTAESRLIDLEKPRESRYTKQEQRNRYAGDRFFDWTSDAVLKQIVLKPKDL